MADLKEVQELKLDDLTLSKGQVRTKVGEGIDELAESIRVLGLLEPIVVTPSSKAGKYEILTGQRRFLAHKRLKKTDDFGHRQNRHDRRTPRQGNLGHRKRDAPRSNQEGVDRFLHVTVQEIRVHQGRLRGNRTAAGHGGLYVKYDRLVPKLKKLVDDGEVNMKTALRAQDAASVTGVTNEEEAVVFAKAMKTDERHPAIEDRQGSQIGSGHARR